MISNKKTTPATPRQTSTASTRVQNPAETRRQIVPQCRFDATVPCNAMPPADCTLLSSDPRCLKGWTLCRIQSGSPGTSPQDLHQAKQRSKPLRYHAKPFAQLKHGQLLTFDWAKLRVTTHLDLMQAPLISPLGESHLYMECHLVLDALVPQCHDQQQSLDSDTFQKFGALIRWVNFGPHLFQSNVLFVDLLLQP